MKIVKIMTILCGLSLLATSCSEPKKEADFKYVVDQFADLQILRYIRPEFQIQSENQKGS